MMVLPLLLTIIPTLFGTATTVTLGLHKEKVTTVLVGIVIGLSATTTVTYLLSAITPLSTHTILLVLALLAIMTAILHPARVWQRWRAGPLDRAALITALSTTALFALIAPKLLIEKPEGLLTGIANAYGDLGWHVATITLLQNNNTLMPENPIFTGERLMYPFMSNFFSAMLLTSGASLAQSVVLPSLVLIPVLLTLFFVFTRQLTGNTQAAIIALLLFICAGATTGWLRIINDHQASSTSLMHFITHLPRDYSGHSADTEGLHFTNPVTSLFLPQRTWLFGMPLGLTILLLLTQGFSTNNKAYLAAGILAGILPLFHAHTVLALIPAILGLIAMRPHPRWLYFFVPAAIIGTPEVLYYLTGIQDGGSFARPHIGWMTSKHEFIGYWLRNTGLLLPLTIVSLFLPTPRTVKVLTTSALFIFATANLFLLAPWEWSNIELLIYWLVLSLPLIGLLTAKALRSQLLLLRGAGLVFIVTHSLSGGIDLWKVALPTAPQFVIWDSTAITAAKKILSITQRGESILTAPTFNSPVALTGRPLYLGYAAHVWTHGGNPWQREVAIKPFYEGIQAILPDSMPNYILIGPQEQSQYTVSINQRWQKVATTGPYTLYALP